MQENDVPMEEIPKSDEEFPNFNLPMDLNLLHINPTMPNFNVPITTIPNDCDNCLYAPSTSNSTFSTGQTMSEIPMNYGQSFGPAVRKSYN